MRRLLVLLVALSLAGVGLALTAKTDSADYRIAGTYFETCTCNPVCPCIFNSAPTYGHCKASVIWHIAEGHSGGTKLDGMNVVVALVSPGHMGEYMGRFKGVLYVDERASEQQRDAIADIYNARFGAMFGNLAGPRSVPIEYARQEDTFSVMIPGTLDAAIEPLEGRGGKTPRVTHAPGGFADELMVARSLRHRYEDADLDSWEYEEGRNGFFAEFEYTAAGS